MEYLSSCNEEQKQAIIHGKGPAMVLAGPGSGKTFVITRRLKYLVEELKVKPEQIAVITFTKAAAVEMKERALSVCSDTSRTAFGTFHSFFYQILKSYDSYFGFTIIHEHEKTQILKQILFTIYSDIHVINQKIPQIKNNISYFLNTNLIHKDCREPDELLKILKEYKSECINRRKFDFDLILSECLNLLQNNEWVRKKWQQYFHYILIDEYQDTNDIQFQIINILAEKHRNLFVVGDDDQSIYGFRGADSKIMFRFLEMYGDAKQIALSENFRSKKKIIDLSSHSIANNIERFPKKLFCHKAEEGKVEFFGANHREDEVDWIIKSIINKIKNGSSEKQICILCRTTNLFPYLCMKLKKDGILYEKPKENKTFYEEDVVQDILFYLRFAFKGRKRKDLLQILNKPDRCLSRSFFENEVVDFRSILDKYLVTWKENFQNGCFDDENYKQDSVNSKENEIIEKIKKFEMDVDLLESLDSYGCVCYILYGIGYEKYCLSEKNEMEREHCKGVFEQLKMQAKIYPNVYQWLYEIEEIELDKEEVNQKNRVEKGVELLTYHGSKGLEFSHVYMPFLNEYIVPHKKALTTGEVEEERRMFYVAMTRAKESLNLSCVSNQGNKLSKFIEEISCYLK